MAVAAHDDHFGTRPLRFVEQGLARIHPAVDRPDLGGDAVPAQIAADVGSGLDAELLAGTFLFHEADDHLRGTPEERHGFGHCPGSLARVLPRHEDSVELARLAGGGNEHASAAGPEQYRLLDAFAAGGIPVGARADEQIGRARLRRQRGPDAAGVDIESPQLVGNGKTGEFYVHGIGDLLRPSLRFGEQGLQVGRRRRIGDGDQLGQGMDLQAGHVRIEQFCNRRGMGDTNLILPRPGEVDNDVFDHVVLPM